MSAFTCHTCKAEIFPGNDMWTLNLTREVEEDPPITVLWAQMLANYCDTCGPTIDYRPYGAESTCCVCSRRIRSGGTKWRVGFDREHVDGPSHVSEVSHRCLREYCEQCAKTIDFSELCPCCPLPPHLPVLGFRQATFAECMDHGVSGLVGLVRTTYGKLVKTFGEPNSDALDEDKSSCVWLLLFEDGTPASIYDWHTTKTPIEVYSWHIGGATSDAVDRVAGALSTRGYEYLPPKRRLPLADTPAREELDSDRPF